MSARRQVVLVTGAAGLVGGILLEGLADRYALRGLDRTPGDGVDVAVDMTDAEAGLAAFEGVDAVVDLAGSPSVDTPWATIRENNIPATLNALENAHRAGVSRFVYASSNHATGMYEADEPYASIVAGRYDDVPAGFERLSSRSAIRPDGPYGVSKALGEAAARYYSDEHGFAAFCLRIGTVNREGRPREARHFATLLTHRDLVQLVTCCLEAPEGVRFGIYYGVSANRWRFWDLYEPREQIGYQPEDDAERWR